VAEVSRDGKLYRMEFERGDMKKGLTVAGKTKKTGTKITFKPDKQIFKKVEFKYDIIQGRMRELAYLNKNLKITLRDERDGKEEVFQYPNGLADFVRFLDTGRNALHKPVVVEDQRGGMDVGVAFEYNDGYVESIFSFANTINTHEGGTHLSGFKAALTRTLGDYARKSGALKEDTELAGEDTREGLTAVVSLKISDPQFEGQTKTKLGNGEAKGVVETTVNEKLARFFEENPHRQPDSREGDFRGQGADGRAQGTRAGAAPVPARFGYAARKACRLRGRRPGRERALHRRG